VTKTRKLIDEGHAVIEVRCMHAAAAAAGLL